MCVVGWSVGCIADCVKRIPLQTAVLPLAPCLTGFVTNGTIQTGAIFLIYVVDFIILVCLRPFSNSIIQCFTTMTVSSEFEFTTGGRDFFFFNF